LRPLRVAGKAVAVRKRLMEDRQEKISGCAAMGIVAVDAGCSVWPQASVALDKGRSLQLVAAGAERGNLFPGQGLVVRLVGGMAATAELFCG
jgi:hypothetical protein